MPRERQRRQEGHGAARPPARAPTIERCHDAVDYDIKPCNNKGICIILRRGRRSHETRFADAVSAICTIEGAIHILEGDATTAAGCCCCCREQWELSTSNECTLIKSTTHTLDEHAIIAIVEQLNPAAQSQRSSSRAVTRISQLRRSSTSSLNHAATQIDEGQLHRCRPSVQSQQQQCHRHL